MQITRQADYAVRAILHLARMNNGEKAATSAIAEEQHIPPSFLAKIISQLSIAGLLHTSRGARGGVRLARNPAEISLLDVIEAIDGPIRINECVSETGVCALEQECSVKPVWCDLQYELVTRLRKTNFGQFIPEPA